MADVALGIEQLSVEVEGREILHEANLEGNGDQTSEDYEHGKEVKQCLSNVLGPAT